MKDRVEFLAHIKETLKSKYLELMTLIEGQAKSNEETGHTVKDSADEALSSVMDKLQTSIQNAEISEMKLIEEALERIERGEYGVCIDCEEPIGVRRLENNLYAARCISCQELQEQ